MTERKDRKESKVTKVTKLTKVTKSEKKEGDETQNTEKVDSKNEKKGRSEAVPSEKKPAVNIANVGTRIKLESHGDINKGQKRNRLKRKSDDQPKSTGKLFREFSALQAKDNQKLDEVLNCTPSTPIDFSAHEIDKTGTRLLPEDILCLPQNPVVLHSNGNGNCLFNSVSIALIGNDSLSRILREATALKLVEDKHLFANHPALAAAAKVLQRSDEFLFPFTLGSSSQMVFDDTKDRYQAIEAEAARLIRTKNGVPCSQYMDWLRSQSVLYIRFIRM